MVLPRSVIVPAKAGGGGVITETTTTEDTDTGGGDGGDNAGGGEETQGFHLLVMSLEVFWSQPLPASGVVTVGRSSKCVVRIDDGLASREHARIHVGSESGVPVLTIEDVGSANGTRVRDAVIKPGEPAAIMPGEAIMVGSTVLMVLQDRPTVGHRRIWSHAYFEARVDEECDRAAKTRAAFALARVRFTGSAPWTRVTPVLVRELTAPHVFASYGPKDYEILFTDAQDGEPEGTLRKLVEGFEGAGLEAQSAVAWYPKDGRTSDALLATANASLKAAASGQRNSEEYPPSDATGMQRVRSMATRAAPSNINVLILGEMGVGKDVLARLIHQMSPRAAKPFVALNCAGLTENLIESELFGHEKNAFTGATAAKVGLFESANGGTVFLNEIGEMPPSMQAKLLQAIELREVRPVGAVRPRPIDVRFLSATNVDIESAVAKGAFRGDLMYRLNTLSLVVPPLRQRKDEIEALAAMFVAEGCREQGREGHLVIGPEAMACLHEYAWPGNIRELKNVMERAVMLCDGPEILLEHLPLEKMRPAPGQYVRVEKAGVGTLLEGGPSRNALPSLSDPEEAADRQRVMDALDACAWSQTRAAELLNVSRRTLVSKLDRYAIPRPQKRQRDDDSDKTNVGRRVLPMPEMLEKAPEE
jgi:two-component system, NtrC family, response regulator AtoC